MSTFVALGSNGHNGPEIVLTSIQGNAPRTFGLCLQFHRAGDDVRSSAFSTITMQVALGDEVLLPRHLVEPGESVAADGPVYPDKRPINVEGACFYRVGTTGVEAIDRAVDADQLSALNDALMASGWFVRPVTINKHWYVQMPRS